VSPKKPRPPAPASFEKALARLEAIVEKLETDELDLDASLALFEEGVTLSRYCHGKLEEVEKRVEIILQQSGGELKTAAFGMDESEAADEDPDRGAE
jgi:exodeoxyribonuclease VII small subunit